VKAEYATNDYYVGSIATRSIAGAEKTSGSNCKDGVDNDCDGLSDISDPGCFVCGDGTCSGDESTTCQGDCSYPVLFRVSGLPAGTNWGVTVGSNRHTSTGGVSQFSVDMAGMGAYDYSFDSIATTSTGADYSCSSGCSGTVTQAGTITATYTLPTQNTIRFSGTLRYSSGEPVVNSMVIATLNGASAGYINEKRSSTDQTGRFDIVVDNVPSAMTNSDFDMSIRVIGEIEAIYECHYDRATKRCS
jgi:hypothetical protein